MSKLRWADLHGPDLMAAATLAATLLVFYAVFSAVYFGSAQGNFDSTGHAVGRDFVNIWTAGVLTWRGDFATIFDIAAFQGAQEDLLGDTFPLHIWSYPPPALFYALPFGTMPYLWAYAAWNVVTLGLFLAAADTWGSPFRAAALILAPATFVNFIAGQNGFLTGALLVGGLALMHRRPIIAGILLGLLCFKPQLGVLIPVVLIAARRWPAFFSAAAMSLAVILASVLAFGLDSWRLYFDGPAQLSSTFMIQGTGPFVLMVPTAFMSARILGLGAEVGYLAQIPFALGAAAAAYWAVRHSQDETMQRAIILAAAFLVTPYAHNYDMTAFSVAVLLLFEQAVKDGSRSTERLVLILAWLLPIIVMPLNGIGVPIGPIILAAVLILGLARVQRRRAHLASSPSAPSNASIGHGSIAR